MSPKEPTRTEKAEVRRRIEAWAEWRRPRIRDEAHWKRLIVATREELRLARIAMKRARVAMDGIKIGKGDFDALRRKSRLHSVWYDACAREAHTERFLLKLMELRPA